MSVDLNKLLEHVYHEVRPLIGGGQVADYIPALGQVNAQQFGMAICDTQGQVFGIEQYQQPFSIQSISKVFSLTLAMQTFGEDIWKRVGCEPSGLPFNSLVQLEYEQGIPRNPFINAGALLVSDLIESGFASPQLAMKAFVRCLSGNQDVCIDHQVADSEYEHRSRNAAMAYLMKSFDNFDNDVEKVLLSYFSACAVRMSCGDLARATGFLANRGVSVVNDERIIDEGQNRQLNALMATSGLYDEAGKFAVNVGLPGKSGVGGGIVAIVPGQFSICVWSPGLNQAGNSLAGVAALESLSKAIDWSVY